MGLPGALTLSKDDRRVLTLWAADCAERTLPIFEAIAPTNDRPREAVEGARAFVRGELHIRQLRALVTAAHASAREVGDPAAVAAACAAGHAAAVARMAAHARGVPAYAALAARLASPENEMAADDEITWALARASVEARDALRRLPPPAGVYGLLGTLVHQVHAMAIADEPRWNRESE